MSIPSGHIITVGGLNVIDRLQDAGLPNPKVPTVTVYETGSDLVVGKILTEAEFSFGMTSWNVNCDMMAMLVGKVGKEGEGPSAVDADGTLYRWENVDFINLACPWAYDTGTEGGNISSGVCVPAYLATALSYKFGVTANAEQTVTLQGGQYYMAQAYPIEEVTETTKEEAAGAFSVETKEVARRYRIGGAEGEAFRHVYGVLVNGVIQQEGVDYEEVPVAAAFVEATKYKLKEIVSVGGETYECIKEGSEKEPPAAHAAAWKKLGGAEAVKIKFIGILPDAAVIRFMYFSIKAHALPQSVHATTLTLPAAVRGRNIKVWLGTGDEAEKHELHGVQDIMLSASRKGTVQREMGYQDPIGFNETGIDCMGSITIDPKEEAALYRALEELTGVKVQGTNAEVLGYLNEHQVPLCIAIYNPKKPTEVLKSIWVGDAMFQPPASNSKVNTVLSLPISWESESGTFAEVKGQIMDKAEEEAASAGE